MLLLLAWLLWLPILFLMAISTPRFSLTLGRGYLDAVVFITDLPDKVCGGAEVDGYQLSTSEMVNEW